MPWELAQFLVSKCGVLPALKQDVGCCLPSFAAVASRVRDPWHSSFEEKVVHPYLLRPELDVDCAMPLAEVLVWL